MPARKPLVLGVDGKPQQLQMGDTLDAILSGGGSPAGVAGVTFAGLNRELPILTAGAPVAVHPSGTGVVQACAQDGTRPAAGLILTTTFTDAAGDVQTAGTVKLADWTPIVGTPTLAPRGIYFLSLVAGKLTTVRPVAAGQVSQLVGVEVAPDTMLICMEQPILL